MKKIKISRNLLYKALIFVITVSVIVYFMPRDSKFNYQFDIGKPWKYGQLMATFDFPIYKGAEVIEKEQDSLMHHFQPFFNIDKEQGRTALEMLKEDCQGELSLVLPADYIRYVERQLKEIYETGILTTEALDSLQKDSTESIMIVDEKLVNQQRTDGLYSVKTAYKKLLTADTLRYRPGVLQAAGLNNYLMPNLTYDKERSEAARQELLDSYSWASGIVLSGQKIIDRGEIVSEKTYNILISYRQEFIKRSETNGQRRLVLTGQILFVGIFMLCFMLYLDLFRKGYYEHRGGMALLFAGITIYCAITGLMMSQHFLTVYMLPYAMLPIIIRVFLDSRTAFLSLVVTVLICSVSLRYPHEFILLQCVAGLTAIYSLRELSQRSQLFQTAAVVTVAYAATYFAYELMTESDPSIWNAAMYINFIINGVLLLFTYPLLFLVEKTFGFTSNVTLVELSNINTPLLRRMSETVPGTFQHSMQVVVISHVTNGLKLADKYRLPKVIKDFISTHHGKGVTKYFYISWKNEHPGEETDPAIFTYPGPNPFTKEQAVLMMADSVEAASRSLPEYTEQTIGSLVDKIVDGQLADGFFRECPITFRDISVVKAVFKEKLKTMYHTRISYPELKK